MKLRLVDECALTDVTQEVTPEVLASLFAEMGSDDQARFYNHLAVQAEDWFCFQLQAITEDDGLTLAGRRVMQKIGEYSHWGIVCKLEKEVEA
jgi:hypothetical protein